MGGELGVAFEFVVREELAPELLGPELGCVPPPAFVALRVTLVDAGRGGCGFNGAGVGWWGSWGLSGAGMGEDCIIPVVIPAFELTRPFATPCDVRVLVTLRFVPVAFPWLDFAKSWLIHLGLNSTQPPSGMFLASIGIVFFLAMGVFGEWSGGLWRGCNGKDDFFWGGA